jgi:hypothetical protein
LKEYKKGSIVIQNVIVVARLKNRAAVTEFHCQINLRGIFNDFEKCCDKRTIEALHSCNFTLKSSEFGRSGELGFWDGFECNIATREAMLCMEDSGKGAMAKSFKESGVLGLGWI